MSVSVCVYLNVCLCTCLCVSVSVSGTSQVSQSQQVGGVSRRSWIKLALRGERGAADRSEVGRPGVAQNGCPEEPGFGLSTFKLDESTHPAICQPTAFLFLTPEKYSLPSLLQHSWWGAGGQDNYGQSEGNTQGQGVGRMAGSA